MLFNLYMIVLREILRKDYDVGVDELQGLQAFIQIPDLFTIIYGLVTDTVRLNCNDSFRRAPRRGYILIFG